MIKFTKQICRNGVHTGKEFVFYNHGREGEGVYRQVVNNKINRYPYYTFAFTDLEVAKDNNGNNVELPYAYHTQVGVEKKISKLANATEADLNKMLVIAHRIITHKSTSGRFHIDQFKITITSRYLFAIGEEDVEILTVKVFDSSNTILNSIVAEISFLNGDFYILHRDFHYDDKTRVGRSNIPSISDKMKESFDHPYLGVLNRKAIDLSELEILAKETYNIEIPLTGTQTLS